MFDGLRNDASGSSFDEPVEYFPEDAPPATPPPPARPVKRKAPGKIFGLNEQQRFIIAIMLLFAVCSLGGMCMFVFGKFVLP